MIIALTTLSLINLIILYRVYKTTKKNQEGIDLIRRANEDEYDKLASINYKLQTIKEDKH